MEAMEGLEELGDLSNQSVRAIAKLADSDKVKLSPSMIPYGVLMCGALVEGSDKERAALHGDGAK